MLFFKSVAANFEIISRPLLGINMCTKMYYFKIQEFYVTYCTWLYKYNSSDKQLQQTPDCAGF